MAARKAARLYYSFDDTDPVKEHLKALISPSPIEKLILMCNDINCMTGKFEELDGTVEPDPKSNSELQQKGNYFIASECSKQNGTMVTL